VYGAAFMMGMSPMATLVDQPVTIGCLRVEDRDGRMLSEFQPVREAAEALPRPHALELVNVLCCVIDEGTGAAIRSRYHRGRGRQDRHHAFFGSVIRRILKPKYRDCILEQYRISFLRAGLWLHG
jgi:hypothetical protein